MCRYTFPIRCLWRSLDRFTDCGFQAIVHVSGATCLNDDGGYQIDYQAPQRRLSGQLGKRTRKLSAGRMGDREIGKEAGP